MFCMCPHAPVELADRFWYHYPIFAGSFLNSDKRSSH